MKRKFSIILSLIIVISFMTGSSWAAERTVGVIHRDHKAFNGYNFFKTLPGNIFNLTDMSGRLIHSWGPFPFITQGAHYLTEQGTLLFGEARLKVHEADKNGNILHTFYRPEYRAHHDWYKMSNGNILMIAWETKTREEAIAAGRNPNAPSGENPTATWTSGQLWPDAILEWNPILDEIVWEWHSWDHIIQDYDITKPNYGVVGEHPEMIDLNYFYRSLVQGADWQHFNAINYNPDLDQIAISVPVFNEIWIIDHSTTTAEAATGSGGKYGMGGRLLYRWGNPATYRAAGAMQLEFEHDVQWIAPGYPGAGNLLIFNNGSYRGYSSVVEIVTPINPDGSYTPPAPGKAFSPKKPIWEYVWKPKKEKDEFYSGFISGAERQINGNTVINEGDDGEFFEVTLNKQIVWSYTNPMTGDDEAVIQGTSPLPGGRAVHRNHRYGPDYPGLAYLDLTPGEPIEIYPSTYYLDIRPKKCPNKVNTGDKEALVVAVLGTAEQDVSAIDPKSILLEGFKPFKWYIEDQGTPYEEVDCGCNADGKDGYPDLILEFDAEAIFALLEEASDGDEALLMLTGYSSADEEWFLAEDCVVVMDDDTR